MEGMSVMRNSIFMFALVLSFIVMGTVTSAAPLQDNGGGLIYDPNLDITWYNVPNMGTSSSLLLFNEATSWVNSLNLGGVGGWRLPSTPGTTQGYTDEGEMGYLRVELGNNPGDLMTNTGPYFSFLGVSPNKYWTSNHWGSQDYETWAFLFSDGYQNKKSYDGWCALAVHDGNIGPNGPITTTPEPATMLLLGFGLAGLAGVRRRFTK
jgi:hypothetical protein